MKTIFEQANENVRKTILEQASIDWADEIKNGKVTVKEMIGTDSGSSEFVEKTVYDVYQGRENIPLIYKQLYRTIEDRNLPKTLTEEEFGPVEVVFLEKFEGGEVKFGGLGAGEEKSVTMRTWAAGVEITEDMLEYNQTWRISDVGAAFGENYNKLLNNLHLSPILDGTYATTGGTLETQKTAQEDGTSAQEIEYDTDLPTTLRNALTVLPRGTKMIINSADRYMIEDAIAASMYADTTPSLVKKKLSPDSLVEYDGEEVTVGEKTYDYDGVTSGEAFLVVPERNFREYVKHGLMIDSGDQDLSRLIATQMVGRTRRGVLTSIADKYGAIKINLSS